MTRRLVLDSFAVLAFLQGEPGSARVAEFLKRARDAENPLFLSVINWGEVYYIIHRRAGAAAAQEAIDMLETLPIELVSADRELTRIAGEFKAGKRMSYADCFAAALAKQKRAELVTGDGEFAEVEGAVQVLWL